jgi:hypothetical protein
MNGEIKHKSPAYFVTFSAVIQYAAGKKYCRRCEVYYYHYGVFCPCCGMALRMSPTSKRDKERLRQLKLRRDEQDRIIRIIKGKPK